MEYQTSFKGRLSYNGSFPNFKIRANFKIISTVVTDRCGSEGAGGWDELTPRGRVGGRLTPP